MSGDKTPFTGRREAGHTPAGMSLRDYFAGQALTGLLATYTTDEVAWEKLALRAYGLADAMLAERAKEGK